LAAERKRYLSGPNDLRLRIAEMPPGDVAHLQVVRDGRSQDISVKLGELPESSVPAEGKQGKSGPLAGVQVEALTPDTAQQLNLPADTKGIVIDAVDPNSAAAVAGLQRGDVIQEVNRKPVATVSEYDQAIKQAGKQSIVLLVNRGGTRTFIVVEPE
jgi:serine protease Do